MLGQLIVSVCQRFKLNSGEFVHVVVIIIFFTFILLNEANERRRKNGETPRIGKEN